MCGLTGYARHPQAKDGDLAWEMFQTMMLQIRNRGTHATGIAVRQPDASFIWKKAAPVDRVLNSDPWKEVTAKIRPEVTIIQGHVRFATHANAHLDEAAHPFKEGKIVGCHNGVITNWKDIAEKTLKRKDMINDSQVPFAMLNEYKNPAKALDDLDGYWALTWTKGASLFMCRTNDAVLSCAYVPSMETLFWNSEGRILRATLLNAGLKPSEFEVWEIKPNTVYRYTPTSFDDKGTNGEKIDAPFRGRHVGRGSKFDSVHSKITYAGSQTSSTTNTAVQEYHGQRANFPDGSLWDGVNARQTTPARTQSAGQLTLKEIEKRFTDIAADLAREIDELRNDLAVQSAEVDFLRKICDDAGLLNEEVDSEESGACDNCVDCPACGKGLADESMMINGEVSLADGGACGLIHEKCLLTDGHVEANRRANGQTIEKTDTETSTIA